MFISGKNCSVSLQVERLILICAFLFWYSENFLVSDFFCRYCAYSMSAIRLNRWWAMLPQSLIPSKAQLFCLSSVLVSLKMSQPNASNKSSLCHKNLDYPIPRTMYEKFVNKKWKERRDIFEDKKFLLQELTRFGKTEKHHLQRIIFAFSLSLKHLKYHPPLYLHRLK